MQAAGRAKAIFVTVYFAAAAAVGAYALYRLYVGGLHNGWIGVALTTLPVVAMVGWWMAARSTPRTSAHLGTLISVTLTGAAVAVWSYGRGEPNAALPLALALAGAAGFIVYDAWYSVFGRRPGALLAVGAPLPDFTVEDADGGAVAAADFRGAPALFLFYRGNWCPLCMTQIKEIAAQYRALAGRGVAVALISPQPHRHTARLAARFDVPFRFLVDPGNRAAEALGIAHRGGLPMGMEVLGYDRDTVLPTAILVNGDGTILLADQTDNYRVRPEPETFLAVLDGRVPEADTGPAG